MTDEEKQPWDGIERRKHNLVVLPGKRDNAELFGDKTADIEKAIHSLLEVKEQIGRILILYESLDCKSLGCVDTALAQTSNSWIVSSGTSYDAGATDNTK